MHSRGPLGSPEVCLFSGCYVCLRECEDLLHAHGAMPEGIEVLGLRYPICEYKAPLHIKDARRQLAMSTMCSMCIHHGCRFLDPLITRIVPLDTPCVEALRVVLLQELVRSTPMLAAPAKM